MKNKFAQGLKEFLIKENLLEKFMANFNEQHGPEDEEPIESIGHGFLFDLSNEGHEFWEKTQVKFEKESLR